MGFPLVISYALRQSHVSLGHLDDGGGGVQTHPLETEALEFPAIIEVLKLFKCLCHRCSLDRWYPQRLPYQISSKHHNLGDIKG